MTLIFENGYFYILISSSLRLKIPDEEAKRSIYHNIKDEFYYINAYISHVMRHYKSFPILFMSNEGNIVLGNRILSSKGVDYISRVKEIIYEM